MNKPPVHKLKASSKQDILDAIPFDMTITDEEGNEVLTTYKEDLYSFVYLGKEITEDATYNEDGTVKTEATTSDYVLADLKVLNEEDVNFGDSVTVVKPNSPNHSWCS